MRVILASLATIALLSGCAEEAEVTEAEAPLATDPVDTGLETVSADPPAGANAGWDLDDDGNFDRAEFTGFGDRGFLGWDNDGDGRLGEQEFEEGWTEAGWRDADTAFGAFDDDDNTFLSNDEFFAEDEFGEWDADGSGVLESSEWRFGNSV